ncbi:5-hydroxytryptamine receptor 1 [Octopus sinensis]|uniref:5-hydroxytryptamine receptor 1 n=1 Tax=Octopus sinensis TaxID=2607531 RepID=A0A7E6FIM1_9MOLL|nr:5-hydroxytryptamine receptor 1 [Octopus sinensis]
MNPNGSNNSLANIQAAGTPFTWTHWVVALILSFTIIGTIIGNSLVCIAVFMVKKLQTPSNFLIVSLAVSDLFVALFVMPLALLYELTKEWRLGDELCDAWTSLDVMLCTASILNLCIISVDRYCVITRPLTYAIKRTPKRIAWLITLVWLLSALISIPPLIGWKTVRNPLECGYSQELGYQIYATVGAFYLPCTIMIIVYYRIWKVSDRISRAETKSHRGTLEPSTPYSNRPKSSSGSCDTHLFPNGSVHSGKEEDNEILPRRERRFTLRTLLTKKTKMTCSKETKATKTLGVIMGGFIACWLPFFILALVNPVCNTLKLKCPVHPVVSSIFLWLGYFNSFMNPLIYARFNQEFRRPFREILCFRCRGMNMRLRTESYAAQYGPDPQINATNRCSLRIPNDSIVRYNSQGQTLVHVGNGSTASDGESKL